MNEHFAVTPEQRRRFEQLLDNAKDEVREKHNQQVEPARQMVARELAESRGCGPLVVKAAELRDTLKTVTDELSEHGFGFDDDNGNLCVRWNAPGKLHDVFEKMLAKRHPIDDVLRKYDDAIRNVWLAQNGNELRAAVEGLLDVE